MPSSLLIAGYGYIAAKVNAVLAAKHFDSPVYGVSRRIKNIHPAQSICMDLDQPLSGAYPFNPSGPLQLLYLLAPPPQGTLDTRSKYLLSLFEQHDQNLSHIILLSTTGVYGDCGGRWIDEQEPLKAQADRAKRRQDAEQQFERFCHSRNIPLTVFRVAGFYARDKLPLQRIREAKPIVMAAQSPFTNRIHADDLAQLLYLAIVKQHPGIFNCCDSAPGTMHEYFTKLAELFELPPPPEISLEDASRELSPGMLSYMQESRRIKNSKILKTFDYNLMYPSLDTFIRQQRLTEPVKT